jgi:hypothetical protein
MTTKEFEKIVSQLRSTLIIGLGGSGHRAALWLKHLLLAYWPAELVEQRVRLLVFDTAQEELSVDHHGRRITLQPGLEFFDIGQTPVPNIKRNLDQQQAIKERLGNLIPDLPPAVLRNGAKQLRPLGLLALLWRYNEVETQLRDAIWGLAGRHHKESQEGINVFIVNSLVGGTGSSAFIDIAYVVRDLFDELGTLADFCYISGVGLLPRAFHGIAGPNLVPNTVASLKELNHCMMQGDFKVRYPNGRVISTMQPPFNVYYLVDGIDERGHTWNGSNEVCRLAAEAVFLQMGSQVGRKHENDFDNLDEVLVRRTGDGNGTFFGSFGLASLVFPGEAVARLCATRQASRIIETGLLADPALALPDGEQSIVEQVSDLVDAAGLKPARLLEQLALDPEGAPLTVDLGTPGWVNKLAPSDVPAELIRYVRDYEQTRIGTDFKRCLSLNESKITTTAGVQITRQLHGLVRRYGLPVGVIWLEKLLATLENHAARQNQRRQELESRQAGLAQELSHLEPVFLQSVEGAFLWRGRRIAKAQHSYMATAEKLCQVRWAGDQSASLARLYGQLGHLVQEQLAATHAVLSRLRVVKKGLATQPQLASPRLSGVTTRSLATESLVETLFNQYVTTAADTMVTLFSGDATPLEWQALSPAEVADLLLDHCRQAFEPIAGMGIEEVLKHPNLEAEPGVLHAWLLAQATPSWNLDRTRLSDGGADLRRLEVIGVPNDQQSVYQRHAKTLVTTGERGRITAFVARVGAPHTALQQWDSYEAAYEQARGHTPLHILPQFQINGERAHQTFALGSIFGFIYSQGSYFYYVPADALAREVRLGQGLANSLQAFARQEGLVQEVRERAEQRVATDGVEATLRALSQYYDHPNGRYPADDLVLDLKRLVRAYADELRQIHQFAPIALGPAADGRTPAPETISATNGKGEGDGS